MDARETLCEIGRRAWMRGFVTALDGNFSVRLDDGHILCTPTQTSKGFLRPDELPVVNLQGQQLSGPKPVTSEIRMHLAAYTHGKDVAAVVHLHPPHSTALAVVRAALPKGVLAESELFLGEVPVVPYAKTGTQAFADLLIPFLERHVAFLLANHGAVTVGRDPWEAWHRMEILEQFCQVVLLARSAGALHQLSAQDLRELLPISERLNGRPEHRMHWSDSDLLRPGVAGDASSGPIAKTITDGTTE